MPKKLKVSAIIQARLGSTRLPGKVMMDLCGKTVLARVIERVKGAKTVDSICVATSVEPVNDIIALEAGKNGVTSYRGSENDVLGRYCKAASKIRPDIVVRVTADNPLTDPHFIDMCVRKMIAEDLEFVAMINMPYGSNVEVVRKDTLLRISRVTKNASDREHVTAYIYKNKDKFKLCLIEPELRLRRPDIRITLDTIKDYHLLCKVFGKFHNIPTGRIGLNSVVNFIDSLTKNPLL